MESLVTSHCEACKAGSPRVSPEEIASLKPEIPEWTLVEVEGVPRLERSYRFPDFKTALDFTNKLGAVAEAEGHHPAILTEWGKVKVSWWTHAIKGLHRNDFIMAAKSDQEARAFAQSGQQGPAKHR